MESNSICKKAGNILVKLFILKVLNRLPLLEFRSKAVVYDNGKYVLFRIHVRMSSVKNSALEPDLKDREHAKSDEIPS